MSHHITRQRLVLQQLDDPEILDGVAYIVVETHNTIQWRIGDVLKPRDVEQLVVQFTVRRGRTA